MEQRNNRNTGTTRTLEQLEHWNTVTIEQLEHWNTGTLEQLEQLEQMGLLEH
jgi:hypothetical protein